MPRFVTIRFSAALADSSTMEVADQCGRRVDSGDTRVSQDEMTVSLVDRPSGHYIASYVARGAMEGSGTTTGKISFHANKGPACDRKGGGRHNQGDRDVNHNGRHDRGTKHEDQHTLQDHASGSHSQSDHSLTDPGHTTGHTSMHSGPTHSDATHERSGSHGEEWGHHGHADGSHEGGAHALDEPSSEEGLPTTDPAVVPVVLAALVLLLSLGLGFVGGLFLRAYATS